MTFTPVPKPRREDRVAKQRKEHRFGNYGPGWAKAKADALKRDGYACLLCGSKQDIQVHHLEHIGSKGRDDAKHALPNLCSVCWRCHSQCEDHTITPHQVRTRLSDLYGYVYENQ